MILPFQLDEYKMMMKPMYVVENLPGNILVNQWILVDVIFPNHFDQFPKMYTCFISMASATDTC